MSRLNCRTHPEPGETKAGPAGIARSSASKPKSCASAANPAVAGVVRAIEWRWRPVDRWRVARSLLVALWLVFVAACSSAAPPAATPSRTLGPGEQWVPAMPPSDVVCPLTRDIGGAPLVLTGSPNDSRLVWMLRLGQQFELRWPVGYSARFTPKLELMDDKDKLVGRAGDVALGGCETSPGVWSIELPGQVSASTK